MAKGRTADYHDAKAESPRVRLLSEGSYVYGRWYRKKTGMVEPELPELVKLLKRGQHPCALDVGCGIGRHVSYLANEGVDTYGFDISRKAIAGANKLLKKSGLKAHLSVGDMFKPLPFESGFFDGVIATRTIHHGRTDEVMRAIGEMDRVTRSGGYVFLQVPRLTVPLWVEGKDPRNPHADEVEPGTLVWYKGDEAGIPHHYFPRKELLQSFKKYKVIRLHAKTSHYGGWCLLARKAR